MRVLGQFYYFFFLRKISHTHKKPKKHKKHKTQINNFRSDVFLYVQKAQKVQNVNKQLSLR